MVKLFNIYYFIPIVVTVGTTIGLYYLLRNKSIKTKRTVIFLLLLSNLLLHFLKGLFPPYSLDLSRYLRDVFPINICAVSVVVFPFIFISNNKTLKDFMFYLGVLSGVLAILYPTEALNNGSDNVFDTIRFYYCHMMILIPPLLMVLLKVHELDYKRIWKMPLCMFVWFIVIIASQAVQAELGIVDLRGNDFFNVNYKNSSLIWGPTDSLAKLFTWLTPKFMTVVPVGANAGSTKYWPFFYMVPAIIVYFTVLPMLMSLPFEFKHIKDDILKLKKRN